MTPKNGFLPGRLLLSAILIILASCTGGQGNLNNNADRSASPDTLGMIRRIDSFKKAGYPMTDLHAHLKGGLTLEDVMAYSRLTGITYGIAANCGLGFPITGDSALMVYYHSLDGYPFARGLQAEGREWIKLFSPDSVAKFDYAFTDAMTFTDDKGRRTRLWMKDEVWVDDEQAFMDMLVDRITGIMENEPINIYVNATFIPAIIQDKYDELWTPERMDRVISAAVNNHIAIEIGARYNIPSATFIKRAKAAGATFTMGTNNTNKDLGFLTYCMDMIETCNLKPADFFTVEKD
ncbi:MAG TPA: hypothetical protein VE870_00865 [Bacteroidales bacterium]|nr:hypothetical protein [Bacteroidales bacterium]